MVSHSSTYSDEIMISLNTSTCWACLVFIFLNKISAISLKASFLLSFDLFCIKSINPIAISLIISLSYSFAYSNKDLFDFLN